MESESVSPGHGGAALGRWWGQATQPSPSTDVMNQLCRVCGEPAAGFHFGAFTCEGCKSFFGRTYNNLGSITECKNNGECVINKKNRTACKACRLRKCLLVGMSKSGSRYGRRSNWFKIHCLLQEQQQQAGAAAPGHKGTPLWGRADEPKDLPAEETIALNNNVLGKDREYSAEAAAALWAARSPFLPVPFLPSPFTGFHPPSQRGFLLPFMQTLPQPPTVFSSPSASSCSQTPSPTPHRTNSYPPPPSPPLDRSPAPLQEERLPKITEETSLAMLRSLGPVQEQPMDLSLRQYRRKSKATRRAAEERDSTSDSDVSDSESVERTVKLEHDSVDSEHNDENFNRRKDPLDLTKPSRQPAV